MKTNALGTARIDERLTHSRIGWLLACLLCLPCFSGLEASNSAVLEIGNRKQLFLDRHVVESLTHAKRVLNPAAKHPANPWSSRTGPGRGIISDWVRSCMTRTARSSGCGTGPPAASCPRKGRPDPALPLGLDGGGRPGGPPEGG